MSPFCATVIDTTKNGVVMWRTIASDVSYSVTVGPVKRCPFGPKATTYGGLRTAFCTPLWSSRSVTGGGGVAMHPPAPQQAGGGASAMSPGTMVTAPAEAAARSAMAAAAILIRSCTLRSAMTPKQEIDKLRRELERHNRLYYLE